MQSDSFSSKCETIGSLDKEEKEAIVSSSFSWNDLKTTELFETIKIIKTILEEFIPVAITENIISKYITTIELVGSFSKDTWSLDAEASIIFIENKLYIYSGEEKDRHQIISEIDFDKKNRVRTRF